VVGLDRDPVFDPDWRCAAVGARIDLLPTSSRRAGHPRLVHRRPEHESLVDRRVRAVKKRLAEA
jgi:hypothetical protein